MPWNGSGSFTSTFNWEADAAAGINILASRMDTQEADYTSNGFGNTLTRDGQGIASANLPMTGFRHTNVGNGVASSDYAALGQVLGGLINWVAAGGTADALTATYSPAISALVDGQLCFVRAASANATTTPTFAPSGLAAYTITKIGGVALAPTDIQANAELILRYNLANTRWELFNPAAGVPTRVAVNDAAHSLAATDRIVAYTAISTARAVALTAASAYPVGVRLLVVDESGSCSGTNTITLNRNGADTISGATSAVINVAYGFIELESNGSSAWTIVDRTWASLSATDQTLSGGANVASNNQGTKSTGTYTVDCGICPLQYITNGGAFTLAAPANDGSCMLQVVNNASAGAISFSGFTVGSNTGDALATTNTAVFVISIWRIAGTSSYFIKALQ